MLHQRLIKRQLSTLSLLPQSEQWTFSRIGSDFANELRNCETELLPIEGCARKIEILPIRNKEWFKCFENLRTKSDKINLVVRPHAFDIWDAIVEERNSKDFAVIGSPGIGKSFGLYYLLKRLMDKKSIIVLDKKKADAVFAFFPVENELGELHYEVHESFIFGQDKIPKMLRYHSEIWYLIDPAKAGNWSGPKDMSAKVVLAASPDPEHLGEWGKSIDLRRLYMKAWDLYELKAAGPYICEDKDNLKKLESRYFYVGGIPRHLFETVNYLEARKRQEAADISSVEPAFLRNVCEESRERKINPISALFTIVPIESENELENKVDDFRKPFKKFCKCKVDFVSKYAAEVVGRKFLNELMNRVEFRNANEGSSVGRMNEECAIMMATRGGRYRVVEMERMLRKEKDKDWKNRKILKLEMPHNLNSVKFLALPPATRRIGTNNWKSFYEETRNLSELNASQTQTNLRIIVIPDLPNEPCTDFADASNRFYKVTISARKRIDISSDLADIIRSCKEPFHFVLIIPWFRIRSRCKVTLHSSDESVYDKLKIFAMELPYDKKFSPTKLT